MSLKSTIRSARFRELLGDFLQILIGCFIGGIAYPLFLVPNSIAPGGLTGVATIFHHAWGWPVGITSLLMNIPLFLISWRRMGKIFVFRSLVAMVLFSLCIDLIPFRPITTDPLLGAVYGGVLLGIGLGMILRGSATTGGTDMIARMVHRRVPFITTGMFLMALDGLVVIAAWIAVGSAQALYALICIFLSDRIVDTVMEGFGSNKACFIMSPAWQAVSDRIMKEMDRGCTQLSARGGWSQEEKPVVLCVIARQEVARLKDIVREEDPKAFMFITDAHEALGEGFENLNKKD